MAVIDTERDTIVRLFETGPLPKMVASSNDSRTVAISHWGDNTVATLDISGDNPAAWHYDSLYVVDYQLKLNFSLTESVNRDNGSGYALRGTVFTPDDHYLLVGCMGGAGGIAVIDLKAKKYLGRVLGMRANIRHLVITHDTLYLSSNADGIIQRIPLKKFLDAARQMQKSTTVTGWEECSVMSGARTIEASPSGRFLFAACNGGSSLCVADTRQMRMVCSTPVDSYPVGLDISDDGSIVIVTSQGHSGSGGGNAVNIYSVEYAEAEVAPEPAEPAAEVVAADTVTSPAPKKEKTSSIPSPTILLWVAGISMVVMLILIFIQKHRQQ